MGLFFNANVEMQAQHNRQIVCSPWGLILLKKHPCSQLQFVQWAKDHVLCRITATLVSWKFYQVSDYHWCLVFQTQNGRVIFWSLAIDSFKLLRLCSSFMKYYIRKSWNGMKIRTKKATGQVPKAKGYLLTVCRWYLAHDLWHVW